MTVTAEHACDRHQPGSPYCYRMDACRCDACRHAGTQFGKRCRAGLTRRIPSGPIAAHLQRLGLTDLEAARRAGLVQTTVTRIRTGESRTVLRSTARKLLALTAEPPTVGTLDATGTTRRLQALGALGYTSRDIATDSGIPHDYTRKLMQGGRPTVTVGTAERVRRCFDRLSMVRPSGWLADRQRRQSAEKGWNPPLAWDDIDNPDEQPHDDHGGRLDIAAEVGLLIDTDTPTSIATRLGYSSMDGLYAALRKAGRDDLKRRLVRQREAEGEAMRTITGSPFRRAA